MVMDYDYSLLTLDGSVASWVPKTVALSGNSSVSFARKITNNTYNVSQENNLDKIKERSNEKLLRFDEDQIYETNAIMEARKLLSRGMVVIEGPNKSGKTSLGMYILKTFDPKYIKLIVQVSGQGHTLSVQDLKCGEKYYLILIDDLTELGRSNELLQDIHDLVTDGNVHIIVTISSDDLMETPHKTYDEVLKPRHRLKLQEHPFHDYERYEILKKHRFKFFSPKHNESMEDTFLQELAVKTNYPWFLSVVHEAHQRKIDDLSAFFVNPESLLIESIESIRKPHCSIERFAALLLIMKQGFFEERNMLQSPDLNDVLPTLSGLLGTRMQYLNMRNAAKCMIGVYTTLTDNRYEFIHKSLASAVSSVFYNISPEHCLSWCPMEFILSRTDVREHASDGNIIVISDDVLKQLLRKRLVEHPELLEIIQHPGFADAVFVKNTMKELKHKLTFQQYKEILIKAISLRQNCLVAYVIQEVLRTLDNAGDAIKPIALAEACRFGNEVAFKELLKAKAEVHTFCMVACKTGKNPGIINYLTTNPQINYHKITRDAIEDWITTIVGSDCTELIPIMATNIIGRPDRKQLLIFMILVLCKAGNYDQLVEVANEVESLNENCEGMLESAIEGGNIETVKYVLKLDEGISLKGALMAACKFNRADVVEHFLSVNTRVLETCVFPLLHLAAAVSCNENPKTLELLLNKLREFDVNEKDDNGSTALHIAASAGNIKSVAMLIRKRASPQAEDNEGNTPIHAHFGGDFVNKPVALSLVSAIGIQNNKKKTPLHVLCSNLRAVQTSILKAMLEQGGKRTANTPDKDGRIPIHILIDSGGDSSAVGVLLEAASDLSRADWDGQTPLHCACQAGRHDIINMLVSKPTTSMLANRNARGETPLHCYLQTQADTNTVDRLCGAEALKARDAKDQTVMHASMTTPGNTDVVRLLLNKGADINAKDKQGRTPMHVLAGFAHATSREVAVIVMDHLSESIDVQDHMGQTALHRACLSDGSHSSELVDILLSGGAVALQKDRSGMSAVHFVCMTCHEQSPKVLEVLLCHLRDRDTIRIALTDKDENGDMPLHKIGLSGGRCRKQVAQILLDAGVDVTDKNSSGDSVLDIARRNRLGDVIQLLVESTLVRACLHSTHRNSVESLLRRELPPDVVNKHQINEMFQMVVQIDGPFTISILEMLIERGAEANCCSSKGLTPIHLAAMKPGQATSRIIDYLASKGGDIAGTDPAGENSLHKVVCGQTGHSSTLVKYLCARGLPVDEKDIEGKTPLHVLLDGIHINIAEYSKATLEELIALEADITVLSNHQHRIGQETLNFILHSYCTKRGVLMDKDIEHIISQGANINSRDGGDGNTVLHRVCMKRVGCINRNIRLLLKHGADKFNKNAEGLLPFDCACHTGLEEEIREMLYTQTQYPDYVETDGPGASFSPTSSTPSLGRPEWFRRSSSGENWTQKLRIGMDGIRNAAGMAYFDQDMEDFEKKARSKLNNHFKDNL